ncbi:competence type IV pilus minor pilin ComGF [Allobacillus sp. GCM10007491]|uniref:ComGF family competence protein n=1 Tax=Allobacillus saliphilus TaxID=2912308 RepID=A0A941CY40_9BACI|nr:ComGF family competence protein [Allobacillus saliphilus]MBR7554205.1 ComGF family competence protein [Allobacillus saliphilus]
MYLYTKNNQGFTLLSTLIALTILMLLSSLILPLLVTVQKIESPSYKKDYEWRQFHFYLMKEFNEAQFVTIEEHAIQFHLPNDVTNRYELYFDKIRRRGNESGHEVILSDVIEFSVRRFGNHTFSIYGEREHGYAYTKYYSFPIKTIDH